MNHRITGALLPVVLLVAGCAQSDERVDRSRAIAAEFRQELGRELREALAAGGPVNAIEVCSSVAPAIAAAASAEAGAQVSRTALRVRNPENAPDAEAAEILREFASESAAQADLPLEHVDRHADGSLRYMRAIVLEPACTVCHGSALPSEVMRAVAERYPEDRATGFEVGDMRGAFLIDWPPAE